MGKCAKGLSSHALAETLCSMLSAVVIIPSSPVRASARTLSDSLVRTLAALVPAAVDGLLRDLTIVAPGDANDIETIADHAGCNFICSADLRAALLQALGAVREDNVLLMRSGRAPEAGYIEEIAELIGDGQRIARMRERPARFAARLFPFLAPAAALLAPREQLTRIADADFARMSFRLGRAPVMRARARHVD